ncbi:MAG TPA: GNAT family N-acetyltransferase [Vicinamibacterales bacterium]|nr:GNAT family N-acetyltransferase [Vicinamibacterales bacterium]
MNVDRYRSDDRVEVDALFRRVFGDAQADASALRWDWQYGRNPNAEGPQIWIARDDGRIVGQYATMPVRLSLAGREVDASWGMDVMVAPERQRQGLGELLFETWDRHSGASLGMGLSVSSHRLFRKLKWPDVGPVPCLVKPLTRSALARAGWPPVVNSVVSLVAAPIALGFPNRDPVDPRVRRFEHFDARFTDLWERVSSKFDFAVRRDARYLEWKYVQLPHLRYSIVALERERCIDGYLVFRHSDEPRGRVTMVVDFLSDPDDHETFQALLRFMERDSREAGSNRIRTFTTNAAFRKVMQARRYFGVASSVQMVAKINAVSVGPAFYTDRDKWHVTFGDSDQDRRCPT